MEKATTRKTEALELLYGAADVLVQMAEELMPGGFTAEERDMLRQETAWRLACAIGGTNVYWPTPSSLECPAIFDAILREFNGRNTNELAVRYGTSSTQIYRIIKRARKAAKRSF